MVSCGFSWNGVTKPFFVDPKLTKVNGRLYTKHLKTQLIPAIEKLYPDNNYIFVQDGASSHTSDICQEFLESKLKKSQFVASNEWPPNSPDLNPLDYYFWTKIKSVVYSERVGKGSFENVAELKSSIRRNWRKAVEIDEVHKALNQFLPRCRKVVEVGGGPIKVFFG